MKKYKNVAVVYDRINKWGGAEQVLLSLLEIFPDSTLVTSVYHEDKAPWAKKFPKIKTSFLNIFSLLRDKHEFIAPLMPIAFERMGMRNFDLVISVTSEFCKGIITHPPTKHVSIILTPTRYLWSGYEEYFRNPFLRFFSKPVVSYLQSWDRIASKRPDKLVAISTEVKKRIGKYWKENSEIVFPPVDVEKFKNDSDYKNGKYFLTVARLVSYKKVETLIESFNKIGKKLVIVGTGSQEKRLRRLAKKNIRFEGFVSSKELTELYKNARGFVQVQEEDFGISTVEAQAAGLPVIAYRKGGASDIIKDGVTGILINEQTAGAIVDALHEFDRMNFRKSDIVRNTERFKTEVFKKKIIEAINNV